MPSKNLDPTGQSGNRRKSFAEFKYRLAGMQKDVLALFDTLPVTQREVQETVITNKTIYEWLVDSVGLTQAQQELRRIVQRWLQTDTTGRQNFFTNYIEEAYRKGAIEATLRVKLLAQQASLDPVAIAQMDPMLIVSSPAYVDRVNMVFTQAFTVMKGFSDDQIVDIGRILTQTITSGLSPRSAQQAIRKHFKTTRARAERISRTEINRSHSLGRLEQNKDTRNRLGIDVRVIHRSALQFERTRRTHGMRHGHIYTIEEQAQWWDEGTNRINCLCSSTEVVVDKDGKPYDTGLMAKFEKQRTQYYGK